MEGLVCAVSRTVELEKVGAIFAELSSGHPPFACSNLI